MEDKQPKLIGEITLREAVENCKDCSNCPLHRFTRGTNCFIYAISCDYYGSLAHPESNPLNTPVEEVRKY